MFTHEQATHARARAHTHTQRRTLMAKSMTFDKSSIWIWGKLKMHKSVRVCDRVCVCPHARVMGCMCERIHMFFFSYSIISIYSAVCPYICLSASLFVNLSVFRAIYMSVCLPVCRYICLSVFLGFFLSMSVCLPIYMFVCLSALSVC